MLCIEIYYYIDHSISLCLPSNIVISFGLYAMLLGNPSYLSTRALFFQRKILTSMLGKEKKRKNGNEHTYDILILQYTLPIKYTISNFFKRSAYIK